MDPSSYRGGEEGDRLAEALGTSAHRGWVCEPAGRNAAGTARNAKWYHIVTLKMRVRRISYIRVAAEIANTPTHAARCPVEERSGGDEWRTVAPSLRHPGPTAIAMLAPIAHVAFFVAARPVDVHDVAPEASWLAREGVALRALYRYRLWTSTAPALREHEAVIGAYVDAIRREFPPGATAIVTELGNARSYPWFRHAGYYLPEFPVYHLRLGRFTPGYLSTREGDSMAALPGPEIRLPPGTRRLVWMVDYWNPLVPRPPGLRRRLPADSRPATRRHLFA